jgi:hypothetical protein
VAAPVSHLFKGNLHARDSLAVGHPRYFSPKRRRPQLPFRTYYSELDRLVANCDAVLFAGYGFVDIHLNMAFEGFLDARRRPVAIIGCASDDAMTMGGVNLGDDNTMVTTLIHTFRTKFRSMRALGRSAPGTVKDLRAAQELEASIQPRHSALALVQRDARRMRLIRARSSSASAEVSGPKVYR